MRPPKKVIDLIVNHRRTHIITGCLRPREWTAFFRPGIAGERLWDVTGPRGEQWTISMLPRPDYRPLVYRCGEGYD
jgi:hypothetical protein